MAWCHQATNHYLSHYRASQGHSALKWISPWIFALVQKELLAFMLCIFISMRPFLPLVWVGNTVKNSSDKPSCRLIQRPFSHSEDPYPEKWELSIIIYIYKFLSTQLSRLSTRPFQGSDNSWRTHATAADAMMPSLPQSISSFRLIHWPLWDMNTILKMYRQVSIISAPNPNTSKILVLSCGCLCRIPWSQLLSREWRCSWSSADRRCSNYIWVIDNFIAY